MAYTPTGGVPPILVHVPQPPSVTPASGGSAPPVPSPTIPGSVVGQSVLMALEQYLSDIWSALGFGDQAQLAFSPFVFAFLGSIILIGLIGLILPEQQIKTAVVQLAKAPVAGKETATEAETEAAAA